MHYSQQSFFLFFSHYLVKQPAKFQSQPFKIAHTQVKGISSSHLLHHIILLLHLAKDSKYAQIKLHNSITLLPVVMLLKLDMTHFADLHFKEKST